MHTIFTEHLLYDGDSETGKTIPYIPKEAER